jgi:hypothetical protein
MSFWVALQTGRITPARDEKYLAWVRTLPSVVSGRTGCVAHHITGHGLKAVGGKVCDYMTIPLLHDEHDAQGNERAFHRIGTKQWEATFDDQRIYVMQTLIQALHEGMLVIHEGRVR